MDSFKKFAGSCTVCLRGTDTGMAFVGELEWYVAGLVTLGIPEREAVAMVEGNCEDGKPYMIRVCAKCVNDGTAPFPAPVLAIPGARLPTIIQPGFEVAA